MKKINNIFWFIFLFIYLEIIYRIFVIDYLWTFKTIEVILFSIPYSLFLALITNLFSEKAKKITSIILSFLISFIFVAQIVYFNFYNSMFSFYSILKGTGQVFGFFQAIVTAMLQVWYKILICFIPFIIYLLFNKKIISFRKLNKKNGTVLAYLFFIISLFSLVLIKIDNEEIYSKNNLYFNTHAPFLTVNSLGLITTEILDFKRYVLGFEEKEYLYIDENNIEYDNDYNIQEISFKEDKKLNNMNLVFKSSIPTKKNKYTGLFKDKNLIVITAESFDTLGIDEKLTPTLYKMSNNGFVFNNYYQPIFPISTTDGEYMNLNSLIPKEGTWTFFSSSINNMNYSLGNMFKNNGYSPRAYHNHSYTFYNRDLSHPNLGFIYEACGNGLERKMNCDVWPESDVELIDSTYKDYIHEEKFLTYYMTVSTHLNYRTTNNYIVNKNYKYVKNLKYSDNIKGYYATMIELDKAMEHLLNYLKKLDILDDTLIVLAPDHYPYGLSKSEMNEVSKFDKSDKFDNFKSTLIMYNPTIKKEEINKVVSSLDILPTIYNLFGLEYDSRLLMGNDVFGSENGLVMLSNRSWITNKGKYDSIKEKYYGDENQEYVDSINKIVYNKFTLSTLILDNDYYNKIEIK